MSQSRNANTSWGELGSAGNVRPVAERPDRRSRKLSPEPGGRQDAQRDAGFHPQQDAYRTACRLFPGFAELPAAFRASIDGYAPLFLAETGPLSLREREVIALTVAGRDQDGFGAVLADPEEQVVERAAAPTDSDSSAARERLIAAFATKVTRRWLAIDGADVERLLDAGISVQQIRAIAEIATVFHFLAELSAAILLRPRRAVLGGAPIAAVASRDPSWRELSRWLA